MVWSFFKHIDVETQSILRTLFEKKIKALNVQKAHVYCNTQLAETLSLVRSHNLKHLHTKATNLLHCAYSDI